MIKNNPPKVEINLKNKTTRPSAYSFYVVNSDTHEDDFANYYFQYKSDIQLFGKPLIRDLINIAVATLVADKRIKRLNNSRRLNTRNIELTIPVSNKPKWDSVKNKLGRMISFISYDSFEFVFVEKEKLNKIIDNKTFPIDADCVSLFSGGLDSFGGSRYLIKKEDRHPFFVSVNHSNTGKLLKNTHESLYSKYSKFIFRVQSPKNYTKEYTQFTRSFLYLSFAVAVAQEYNLKDIFIPETGVVATQVGLKDGRLTTRTVHPHLIDLFNELIDKLFEKSRLKVKNPFEYSTKTEVVSHILPEKEEYISETVTCPHRRWYNKKHCGMCMSCIIRKIALVNNDVKAEDEYSSHSLDLIDDVNLSSPKEINRLYRTKITHNVRKKHYKDGIAFILDLIKLVRDLQYLTDKELRIKYPEFTDKKLLEMYKRFKNAVIKTMNESDIKENRNLLNR